MSLQGFSTASSNTPAYAADPDDSSYVPRPKRIACVVCRRRKLRCDGKKPSCGTCSRLGHDCSYDEVRKKSGPKRGYVKQLEARLAQVETLLKNQDPEAGRPPPPPAQPQNNKSAFDLPMSNDAPSNFANIPPIPEAAAEDTMAQLAEILGEPQPFEPFLPGAGFGGEPHSWEMISLGLEEPLPAQDVIDELQDIFFEKVYPSMPIIHRPRYLASMNLSPEMRPPVCLRYIMWSHAASMSDKYSFLHQQFYERARKYAERDEMKGLGEQTVSVGHCQAWILIATYEFRMMFFPRAWLNSGKASRLALMLGLNRLDGAGLDVKQTTGPPRDWLEREERRRIFWMAFCVDRYASIGTGWPMMIDERDIMTNLPAPEDAFLKGRAEQTSRLPALLKGDGIATLSPFANVVLMSSMFGRNLTHLHRPDPQDNDHDLNGEFWKRHRTYDNLILGVALSLPSHLRLPAGISDPNVIFCNMCIHTAAICLHQAAIFKAEKNKMPNQIIMESKRRCIVAADQVSSIMKMICHTDLTTMNPFMSFCIYVAARVFIQYLKSRPDDSAVRSSLQFLVAALETLKTRNPLTESFLAQLDVDIEGTVLQQHEMPIKIGNRGDVSTQKYALNHDNVECTPLMDIRQTQACEPSVAPLHREEPQSTSHLSSSNSTASLPNRQRTHPSPDSSDFQNASQPSRSASLRAESRIPGTTADMDFSPDTNNPPSDHGTPSTLISNSNSSFSNPRLDNKSSLSNSQLRPEPQLGNSMNIGPDATKASFAEGGMSFPSLTNDYFSNSDPNNTSNSNLSLDATEAGFSFTVSSSGWAFSPSQPEMVADPTTSLNETQWQQIFENPETWQG